MSGFGPALLMLESKPFFRAPWWTVALAEVEQAVQEYLRDVEALFFDSLEDAR